MRAFLAAQRVKNLPAMWERPGFHPWVGKMPWRREWLPIPVFLPGESHGQRSLVGYSSWGHKDSSTAEYVPLQDLLYYYIGFHVYLSECPRSSVLNISNFTNENPHQNLLSQLPKPLVLIKDKDS